MGRYEAVSVCSGVMEFDLGLDRTGRFRLLAAVEKDGSCCDAIRANRDAGRLEGDLRLYEADLERLDPRQVMADLGLGCGELPVLVGAPPCQSYSSAGKRKGVADPRGLLLWQYLWWLEAFRPQVFVLENVTGLLSARLSPRHPPRSLLRRWLDDLPAEYRADIFTVNAADYGVPQFRQRVIVIGNRHGLTATFPRPTHGPAGTGLPPWRTLRDALHELAEREPLGLAYCERHRRVLDLVPPGGCWRDLPDEVARESMGAAYHSTKGGRSAWWRRLHWDRPSPCLLTSPVRSMNSLCHPDITRPLTVREYAAIQCFPPEWEFRGTVTSQYRQIGNAVPVPLGKAAGIAAASLLDSIESCAAGNREVPRFRFVDMRTCKRVRMSRGCWKSEN